MGINIKDYFEESSDKVYLKDKGPDRKAAAARYILCDQVKEEWLANVNSTNTRDMPKNLERLYELAGSVLDEIAKYERDILMGVRA